MAALVGASTATWCAQGPATSTTTLVVDGTQAAARLLYSGTHNGPLAGIAPTGARFSYAGAAFFKAHHGQLTSAWGLGDLGSLREQLGS